MSDVTIDIFARNMTKAALRRVQEDFAGLGEQLRMSNRIVYKYIGNGAEVVGVPARDIREDEAAEFEDIIKANMETPNPAYREIKHAMPVADEKPAPKTSEAKDARATG